MGFQEESGEKRGRKEATERSQRKRVEWDESPLLCCRRFEWPRREESSWKFVEWSRLIAGNPDEKPTVCLCVCVVFTSHIHM